MEIIDEKTEKAPETLRLEFGGETKELTYEEVAELAAKGMKYDALSPQLSVLKMLAEKRGLTVPMLIAEIEKDFGEKHRVQLLEKCQGNEELVKEFLALEAAAAPVKKEDGFGELNGFFPEIKQISDLPYEVVAAAQEKGTQLLDEYLRLLLRRKRSSEKHTENQTKAQKQSIGSQRNGECYLYDPVRTEFIKGLWN